MSMGQLLFSFQGRLNRKPYWLTSITILVIILLILVSALVLIREHQFALAGLEFVLLAILYLPLMWVGFALGAKRLHDRDKSGWWLVLFYLAPGILGTIADRIEGGTGIVLHVVGFAISVWAFVELGCLRGTVGPNQYGPDPLAPSVPASSVST
jgi:uncharacterized membrane protein YhaH (DUF805 family)